MFMQKNDLPTIKQLDDTETIVKLCPVENDRKISTKKRGNDKCSDKNLTSLNQRECEKGTRREPKRFTVEKGRRCDVPTDDLVFHLLLTFFPSNTAKKKHPNNTKVE